VPGRGGGAITVNAPLTVRAGGTGDTNINKGLYRCDNLKSGI
jgi:hypothetical protein